MSTDVVKRLLLLGAFLQRQASRAVADLGINQQQFVLLKEIEEKEPINQKDLCSELLFQKSNVSKMVAKLECMGLVKRQVYPHDNRVTFLSVSKKGRGVLQEGMSRLNQWNTAWLDSLSLDEIEQIAAALKKLTVLTQKSR